MADLTGDPCNLSGHAIIGGFGLPGREAANVLLRRGMCYCVVDYNPEIVQRCRQAGLPIILGNIFQEQTLRQAGIEKAEMLILSVPNEQSVLATIELARRLNPRIRIIARCHNTSAGMTARQLGAEGVVVAEQVVAEEFKSMVWDRLTNQNRPDQLAAND